MPETSQKRLFHFGVFEADQQTGELRKQGRRLSLQGQPFDILIMLLERPGQLVSRAEICQRLWPDGTFVDFDHSLNTAVNKVREALGDSAGSPKFVETLARRGYRFIAPVRVEGSTGEELPKTPLLAKPARSGAPLAPVASVDTDTLLSGANEMPEASRAVVWTLFLLLQVMYLSFYFISLARLHVVEEMLGRTVSHPLVTMVVLIVTAAAGIPTRLFLFTAAAFRAPGLRKKFLRLFPFLFPFDELWALVPFLLLREIGFGLALGLTAILLYAPFAQRSLILMGAGECRGPSAPKGGASG